ncbi:MAG: VPLPA-CTERM sorting domain-containing protein [Pseudomonadota bacterium]
MKITLCALAASLAVAMTSLVPAPASAAIWQLFDHEDGGQSPPFWYGLRLDDIAGQNNAASYWSFETTNGDDLGTSLATLNRTGSTATMTGQMRNNDTGALWDLDVSMTGVVSFSNGWAADAFTGTLSLGTEVINLPGKDDNNGFSFTFATSGGNGLDFRGGLTTAAGWVDPMAGGFDSNYNHNCCNDFLATAVVVPLPAAAWFLIGGMGALGAVRMRRKPS